MFRKYLQLSRAAAGPAGQIVQHRLNLTTKLLPPFA